MPSSLHLMITLRLIPPWDVFHSSCDLWLSISHWNVYGILLLRNNPHVFVFWRESLTLKFPLLLHFIFYQQEAKFRTRTLFFWWWDSLSEFAQHLKLQAETGVKYIAATAELWKAFFRFAKKKSARPMLSYHSYILSLNNLYSTSALLYG